MSELIVKEFGPVALNSIGSILFMDNEMQFWAWSPYDKCSFRCVFCSVEAQGKSKPQITKEEIGPLFDDFKRLAGDEHPLVLGATTDAYPEEEEEHGLARQTLIELSKRNIRTVLVTHGAMHTRDLDILKDMESLENIGMSIPHHDNEQIKRMEPGAPTFEARIEAAWKLYEANLPVHVNISPWIPEVTEADKVARELPEDMVVNVGVLSYNEHQKDLITHVFGREVPSARRVFGKKYPEQKMISDAFLAAYDKTGHGTKGNLKWLIPPGSGKNYTTYLPDKAPSAPL